MLLVSDSKIVKKDGYASIAVSKEPFRSRKASTNNKIPRGQNQKACESGNLLHGSKQLASGFLLRFHRIRQLADIAFAPRMDNSGIAFSGNHRAFGEKRISRLLHDRIVLPGQQRFIHLQASRQYHCITADLPAAVRPLIFVSILIPPFLYTFF